jgi:hypothetical protein
MHSFDFLSESPKLFIFRNDVNKTNFGGVLTIIYLILMLFISIYYIIDYCNTENFSIEYKKNINNYFDYQIREINEKNELNQNPELNISVIIIGDHPFKEKIKLYDWYGQKFFDETIKKKVTDFYIVVYYKCDDENCTLPFDTRILKFWFSFVYESYSLEHQNTNSPLTKIYKVFSNAFYFDNRTEIIPNWHNIIYKEKKGFFKNENNYINGYFDGSRKYYHENLIMPINGTYYKILQEFHIDNFHETEDEYLRIEKSILDYVAIVFSFYSNGFFIAKWIFDFYSKNFNNFKIIENILSREHNLDNYKKPKTINLNNKIISDNNFIEIPYYINNEKSSELLIGENESKEFKDGNKIILKKIRFIHFFLNNLYCNCFSKYNQQRIINICNEILLKYLSLDSIAYNQLVLENLFKDYKWNNTELSNIENNDLIIKLKNNIT